MKRTKKPTRPVIEINCYTCKHYDACHKKCREGYGDIPDEEKERTYCDKWISGKTRVFYTLCDFNKRASKKLLKRYQYGKITLKEIKHDKNN